MDRYKFRGKAIEPMADGNQWINDGFGAYYVELADGGIECVLYTPHGTYQVDPSTVGQCTGLKDKNGKEIYEGDIVKFTFDDEDSCMGNTYDEIYIVEWNNRYLQIEFSDNKYHPLGTHQGKYNLHSLSHMSYEIEVISNIHDNPELLEG